MKAQTRIYLDHAATTPLDPTVAAVMRKSERLFGNTMSLHREGQESAVAVESARRALARHLGVPSRQVVFTSGATEANVWALRGVVERAQQLRIQTPHVIVSAIEHASVLDAARALAGRGVIDLTEVPVQPNGIVRVDDVVGVVRDVTVLVSVMMANNEIGTLQPVHEIADALGMRRTQLKRIAALSSFPYLHTDAAAAFPWMSVRLEHVGADLMTLSAHKIGGPKGIGALVLREGVIVEPLLHGGGQEAGMRAGTSNVPAILGFASACAVVSARREKDAQRIFPIRDRLIERLCAAPYVNLNGSRNARLPNNVNVHVAGVNADVLLARLDLEGIAASAGSACTTGALEPSHVIRALGSTEEESAQSIRLTLGRDTTAREVDRAADGISRVIEALHSLRMRTHHARSV